MGLSERVAAIEAKLGIETPAPAWGLFWDKGDSEPIIGVNTGMEDDEYVCDFNCTYDKFLPFTPEQIEFFKGAGVPLKHDEE